MPDITDFTLDADRCLPEDGCAGTLVARVWVPGARGGPTVGVVCDDGVYDISAVAATVAGLFNEADPLAIVRGAPRDRRLGSIADILANSVAYRQDTGRPWFLAPIDLQAVKAAGVTFASSMLERVVEEQARGDKGRADDIRRALVAEIGTDLSQVKPGSDEATRLKAALHARGLWSQYLEVGIGAEIGINPASSWNNPEPEIVLAVSSSGTILGATLGNDVNLRDFEGRSALLLSKAKDNTGSSAIGPFVRLFDETFNLDHVRNAEVDLRVEGTDRFVLTGTSSMRMISRDPADIVGQTVGATHQYPDGFVLFLGTMFAPTEDRGEPGAGFTHRTGDRVSISSPKLGTLVNRVNTCDRLPHWNFGTLALMSNLSSRGLLAT